MRYHARKYDVYCVIGSPDAIPIWNWKQWSGVAKSLDPILAAGREGAAVRCNQFLSNPRTTCKFGRIAWSEKGHQKWTHDSPTNSPESSKWEFLNVEVWVPSWNVCSKERLAPDVFLEVGNESVFTCSDVVAFNPVIVFAVAVDLAERIPDHIQAAVRSMAVATDAKLCGFKRRTWGKSTGETSYSDSIQDLFGVGLFKSTKRSSGRVDFGLFEQKWTPVDFRS